MSYFDHTELQRLDALIKDIENTASVNADLVKRLSEFSISITGDISDIINTDPLSQEYLDKVRRVHEEIIGKRHSSEFEGVPGLDLDY